MDIIRFCGWLTITYLVGVALSFIVWAMLIAMAARYELIDDFKGVSDAVKMAMITKVTFTTGSALSFSWPIIVAIPLVTMAMNALHLII